MRVCDRRAFLAGIAAGGAGLALAGPVRAQETRFFRVASGPSESSMFQVASLIGQTVSSPPGARECARGGTCGVPGMIVVNQTTAGSLANIDLVAAGRIDSALCQADLAYWAFHGTGPFARRGALANLRAIANLYPESVHLVVRKAANVRGVADLKGKKVSLDEPGSGTLVNARAILGAYGLGDRDVVPEFLKPNQAAEKMKDGSVDAFFFTGGFPAAAISELASTGSGIDILPITGAGAEKLVKDFPFFSADEIPAGTYKDVGAVKTVAVGAHWVTSSKISAATVYAVTKALWSDKTRAALDAGHAKGKSIQKATALSGLLGVPLHEGAARFYKEAGLMT